MGLDKENLKVGRCPHCPTKLHIADGESVECPCCGENVHSSELRTGVVANAQVSASQSIVADVRSMESVDDAVVFLKNYFDNYDWNAYLESTIITIPEVEEMVKSVKIKSGSKPAVWGLDFDSVATPLAKRLEGIANAEKKMEELYSDVDNTNLMETFDAYKAVIKALIEEKAALIKRMESAIANAEGLGLEKAKVSAMNAQLAKLAGALNALVLVEDVVDVEALKKARAELDKKKVAELKAKGIDAVKVYAQAVDAFQTGRVGYRKALDLFIQIAGYADSNKYIHKIDKYFNYNGEIIFVSNKPFVLERKETKQLLDVAAIGGKDKKKGKKKAKDAQAEEEFVGATYELKPIVNQEPAKDAVLTGITEFVSYYATDLYFIKKGKELCSFNTETLEEKVIDEKGSDYVNESNKKWYNATADKLYICKKLALTKGKLGCIKKLMKKKAEFIKHVNNYSLVEIDLSQGTTKTIVEELVDVHTFDANNIFYRFAEEKELPSATAKSGKEKVTVTKLMVVDVATGTSKDALGEDSDIHKIVGTKVIYSYHTPNELNKELHVYDLADNTDALIEENVYTFVDVIRDKVYYKVGNSKFSPLFSNSFKGDDRVQIVDNMKKITAIRGNWIYIVVGSGANKLLRKISHDGKTIIDLCCGFKNIVKVTDSYIFYVDCFDNFCSIRFDGEEDKVIASDIDADNIIVEKNAFYYLRKERVASNDYAYSLYTMDGEGKNVKKLAFDVDHMEDFDEDKLYISKTEIAYFEITIPEQKGKTHVEKISRTLKKVIEFNKVAGTFNIVRVSGLPSTSEYEFKKGCFGKKEKVESTYKQVRGPLTYYRELDAAGSVFASQVAEANAEETAKKQEKKGILGFLKPGAKKDGKKSGCLKLPKIGGKKKGCLK